MSADDRAAPTVPAWACLTCRANETREDVAQFEAPCRAHTEAQRNYAAFVGAEAELARLKSTMERLADKFGATPDRSMSHRNVAISIRTALGEDDR